MSNEEIPEGMVETSNEDTVRTMSAMLRMLDGMLDTLETVGPDTGMSESEFVDIIRLNADRISAAYGVDLTEVLNTIADFIEASSDLESRLVEDYG